MIAEAFAYASLVSLLVGLGAASTERVLAEIKRPRRLAWVAAYLVALAFPLLSMLLVADAPAPLGARLDVTSREAAAVYSEIDWSMLLLSLWGGSYDAVAAALFGRAPAPEVPCRAMAASVERNAIGRGRR